MGLPPGRSRLRALGRRCCGILLLALVTCRRGADGRVLRTGYALDVHSSAAPTMWIDESTLTRGVGSLTGDAVYDSATHLAFLAGLVWVYDSTYGTPARRLYRALESFPDSARWSATFDQWERPPAYAWSVDSAVLRSLGADGKLGTPDDITVVVYFEDTVRIRREMPRNWKGPPGPPLPPWR